MRFTSNFTPQFQPQQGQPKRHLGGIFAVFLLHVILVYALLNGLGNKVVEVLKAPLSVSLLEEVKTTPPPPRLVVPPPKFAAPPPPFVPPPEVQVQAPRETPNVIAVASATPVAETPRVPEAAAPAPRAAPQIVNVGVVCPNHLDVRSSVPYPPQALRLGMSGEVMVEFTVAESGQISDVSITKSTNQIFNAVASNAVSRFHCSSPGRDVRVRVPFEFKVG
jgi:protein TonB